ncbi:MAG: type IV pilus modification PilV family protein [Candidatus Rifleibacteriota bacterium]
MQKDGFSLVELVIAIAILVLALAPMMPKFSSIKGQSVNARNYVIATSLASSKIEELKLADKITPEMLKPEVRLVNNTEFEISPEKVLLPVPASGFENAKPPISAFKIKTKVKWSMPGNKKLKHEIFLQSLFFVPENS